MFCEINFWLIIGREVRFRGNLGGEIISGKKRKYYFFVCFIVIIIKGFLEVVLWIGWFYESKFNLG